MYAADNPLMNLTLSFTLSEAKATAWNLYSNGTDQRDDAF